MNDHQDPMVGMYGNPSMGLDMMVQFAPDSHSQLRGMGVGVSPYQQPRGVAHLDMSEAVPTQAFSNEPLNEQQLEELFATGVSGH